MVLFMLLVVPVKGLAQGVTISGQVTDDMDVVIGATVKVVPGNTGTVTDVDGNFKLTVPSSAKSLVISYVGYKTKTVPQFGIRIVHKKVGSLTNILYLYR